MANVKLDFSRMKHVSSDEHTTTLQHPDGHRITLAHKALSPENQKALSALAKISGQNQTPMQADESKHQMFAGGPVLSQIPSRPYKNGGSVKMYADGTDQVAPSNSSSDSAGSTIYGSTQGMLTDAEKTQKIKDDISQGSPMSPKLDPKSKAVQDVISKYGSSGFSPEDFKANGGQVDSLSGQGFPADPKDRIDKGYGAIIVKAKDGEIKQPKFCAYCGGMAHGGECSETGRKMYAGQDQPVSADDNAPVVPGATQPDISQQVVPRYTGAQGPMEMSNQTPEEKRTKEIYNQLVSLTPVPGDPDSWRPSTQRLPGTQYDIKTGTPPARFDPGTYMKAEQSQALEQQQNADAIANKQQQVVAENAIRARAGLPPLPVPDVPNGPQIPGSPTAPDMGKLPDTPPTPPQLQPNTDPLEKGTQDAYGMMQSGYNSALAGIRNKATAEGQLGQDIAGIQQQAELDKNDALNAYQTHFKDLMGERDKFIQDYQDGHIDPEQFWKGDKNGNGSHSKILAGLGMIIAGFNPTGRPNAAIDFLKYQMDKNMQAQMSNQEMRGNLLRANLEQFHNIKDAAQMTNIMQSDIVQAELAKAAAAATSPLANAAAQQAAGQLQMEKAPMFQQLAMQRAMMNLANNGGSPGSVEHMMAYMRAVNPETAKDMAEYYVPGVGLSPTTKVPEDVRQQLVAKQTLHNAATDLLNYANTHTNLIPGTPEYNTGVQKAAVIQQYIREGLLGTVFRESEKPLLKSFVDDNPAGAFKKLTTIPKLRELINSNSMSMNTLKRAYNLPEQQLTPKMLGNSNEGKIAVGPNGQRIQMVNGKWQPAK